MKDKELYLLLDTSFLINLVSESALFHDRAYELEKIDYVVSADSKAQKTYQWLKDANPAHFEYLNITKTAVNDFFGELPFPLE